MWNITVTTYKHKPQPLSFLYFIFFMKTTNAIKGIERRDTKSRREWRERIGCNNISSLEHREGPKEPF